MLINEKFCQLFLIASFLCCFFTINAQPVYRQQLIDFISNGDTLDLAMAGGLNNPIFSEVDLDNNQVMDLVVFDRQGEVFLPFYNNGTPDVSDYKYSPKFAENFPKVSAWALLRDYDQDGIGDLICYAVTPPGARVYKGYYDSDNRIAFNLEKAVLQFPGFNEFPTNIFISSEDLSAFDDIDGDGDMDVLTFGVLGGYLELYDNKSVEMGYGLDSLIFELKDDCWGRSYESGLTPELLLSPSIDSCIYRTTFVGGGAKTNIHAGSTVLTLDLDNDNDKDVILGDVSFPNLVQLTNDGDNETAWFGSQDAYFPSYDVSGNVIIFPASYYMDVNNDGHKDLLASPSSPNVSENLNVVWHYKNVTDDLNPQFSFVQEDFLIDEMVDLGTGAYPAFFDHNGDGLLDIVVGHYGYFVSGGTFVSSLLLYENVGTAEEAVFELVDSDYVGLSYVEINAIKPAFADLDGDGFMDLIAGETGGKLIFAKNMDNGNGMASFPSFDVGYQGISIGQYSAPAVLDVNQDGLLDLIIGERNGNVNFYQNAGTSTAPNFVSVNSNFGNIDTRQIGFPTGFSTPIYVEENNSRYIYTGSSQGDIQVYEINADSIYAGSFVMVEDNLADIKVGNKTCVTIGDVNNDGIDDYLVGNERGGLSLYGTNWPLIDDIPTITSNFEVNIFPNPTDGDLNIVFGEQPGDRVLVTVFDVLGRTILNRKVEGDTKLATTNWPAGVYFLNFQYEGASKTLKIAVE